MRGVFNPGCASVQGGRETTNANVSPTANETHDILIGIIWSPLVGLTFRPETEDAARRRQRCTVMSPYSTCFFSSDARELLLVRPPATRGRPTKTSAGEGHDGWATEAGAGADGSPGHDAGLRGDGASWSAAGPRRHGPAGRNNSQRRARCRHQLHRYVDRLRR